MRPVLLEMHGFASFREPTTVDFRGVDYFALVGPTGSGKSTVIDALTFALYGSVPRWDDRRTVGLALAPTVGRGTVRFVFDVEQQRYAVARELRRAVSGSVSVRGARLERLRDPSGVGGVDEETDPIADGAAAVTAAVEQLLGLPFGDFCTCVVLPQGDFAEFLHTEPRKRQEKLVRILGLGIYDVIAREANSEATAQRQRADLLTEQLLGYADATEEAERAATARVGSLEALAARVGTAVPELAAATAAVDGAQSLVARLAGERARLGALTPPDGLTDLDARHRGTAAAVASAAARVMAAEAADTASRERLAAAPDRGPLEQTRRDHAELAVLSAELPGARERHDKARAADAMATREGTDARAAADAARAVRDRAAIGLEAAFDAGRRLTVEREALGAPAVPAGLDVLDLRRAAAAGVLDRAATALVAAEAAEHDAREALAAAPPRAPLEQARRDHHALAAALAEHRDALVAQDAAAQAAAAATARVRDGGEHLARARAEHAARQRADLAAALRPTLVVGDPCPVCTQAVGALPDPLPSSDGDGGDAVRAAERADHETRRREAAALAANAAAGAAVERLAAVIEQLRAGLAALPAAAWTFGRQAGLDVVGPGVAIPSPALIEATLTALDRLTGAVEECGSGVRGARRERERAAREVDAVGGELSAAAGAVRAARDPLVPLGAPAIDDGDVLTAWRTLVAWARGQAAVREQALPAAREAATLAQREHAATAAALRVAEQAAQDRRRDEAVAARAEQEARGVVEGIEQRCGQLRSALEGAPSDDAAAAALGTLTEWEAAARTADGALRAARAAQRSAERAAAEVGQEVGAAWDALRTARDPLVPLGAPAIAGDDLLAGWSALRGWARAETEGRDRQLHAADAAAVAARQARDGVEQRLAADLADHDVPVDLTPLALAAPAAVAATLERSRGVRERVAERRATVAAITADRDAAESAQQVARMLGTLLRSDGFPRWLVASALDALVADASRSLAELSGGQFELTHDHGDFLVVDHADADAMRPVKTLSGGETFQASLALALALSTQMSGLAARGAARLESIFLDEGFGTLDEANLEVVAGTLETLATRGDRVVGVITHVPALAERVPVRFSVSRDQRTSSVVREGS